jgi:hypothetical protein
MFFSFIGDAGRELHGPELRGVNGSKLLSQRLIRKEKHYLIPDLLKQTASLFKLAQTSNVTFGL